jgi:predicted Zn-dependent protease
LGICDPQSIHISDSKIRVQVNAILFYDNEEYFCTSNGDHSDLYNEIVINQSNLPEEIIKSNIHFIIYGGKPDGEDCNVDILGGAGYGRYSPNRGVYYNKDNAQGLADHFTHELGHCLGLDDHSWVDGFCDTDGVKYESNKLYGLFKRKVFINTKAIRGNAL